MDAEYRISRLERLGQMLEKGIISEAEFAEEKRKLFAAGDAEASDRHIAITGEVGLIADAPVEPTGRPISDGTGDLSSRVAPQVTSPISTQTASEHTASDSNDDQGEQPVAPKFWRVFVGFAGLLLMGHGIGHLRESVILVGLLLCGAAYLVGNRANPVSWLPPLPARLLAIIGLTLIMFPLLLDKSVFTASSPANWTCDDLESEVLALKKGHLLKITGSREVLRTSGELKCAGTGQFADASRHKVSYRGYVDEDHQIMVEWVNEDVAADMREFDRTIRGAQKDMEDLDRDTGRAE